MKERITLAGGGERMRKKSLALVTSVRKTIYRKSEKESTQHGDDDSLLTPVEAHEGDPFYLTAPKVKRSREAEDVPTLIPYVNPEGRSVTPIAFPDCDDVDTSSIYPPAAPPSAAARRRYRTNIPKDWLYGNAEPVPPQPQLPTTFSLPPLQANASPNTDTVRVRSSTKAFADIGVKVKSKKEKVISLFQTSGAKEVVRDPEPIGAGVVVSPTADVDDGQLRDSDVTAVDVPEAPSSDNLQSSFMPVVPNMAPAAHGPPKVSGTDILKPSPRLGHRYSASYPSVPVAVEDGRPSIRRRSASFGSPREAKVHGMLSDNSTGRRPAPLSPLFDSDENHTKFGPVAVSHEMEEHYLEGEPAYSTQKEREVPTLVSHALGKENVTYDRTTSTWHVSHRGMMHLNSLLEETYERRTNHGFTNDTQQDP